MPKRKREADDPPRSSTNSAQTKHVEEKLFHAKKILQRALKLAKGFERQKLGRRHKTAAQKSEVGELSRLDAEITALKNLDLTTTAESHLYKTIQKEKALCSAPTLPTYVTVILKSSQEAAIANVIARLYNSKPVKDAMTEALTSLRVVLGVATKPTQTKKIRVDNGVRTDTPAELSKQPVSEGLHQDEDTSTPEGEISGSDEGEDEGEAIDEELDLQAEDESDKWADLSLDEDALQEFDKRLGGSSDDDSDGEDMKLRRAALRRDLADNLSISPEQSLSPVPEATTKSRAAEGSGTVRAKTDFLPSLTMGGYWSGSESEPEDDVDVAPRKNRRGQRARQHIWEKKYGKGAKHIQNSKVKQTAGRDEGWDAKRGAHESGRPRRGPGMKDRGLVASGGNATQVVPRKRTADKLVPGNKPLHPSWEAAKKAKEQKQTAAFAGKKMTFD